MESDKKKEDTQEFFDSKLIQYIMNKLMTVNNDFSTFAKLRDVRNFFELSFDFMDPLKQQQQQELLEQNPP